MIELRPGTVEAENVRLRELLIQAGIETEAHVLAARLQSVLIAELHHRVKNSLAIMSSIVSQSLRTADTIESASTTIHGRLRALGKAHDLLLRESWTGAGLRSLVEAAIGPFQTADKGRFDLEGDNFAVSSGSAIALTMVLLELCTNAVKHGSLAVSTGRVAIAWSVDLASDRFN